MALQLDENSVPFVEQISGQSYHLEIQLLSWTLGRENVFCERSEGT